MSLKCLRLLVGFPYFVDFPQINAHYKQLNSIKGVLLYTLLLSKLLPKPYLT